MSLSGCGSLASMISAERRPQMPIRWGLIVGLAPVMLLSWLVGAPVVRVIGVEAFEMDGPSMEPTVLSGDRFLVDKAAYGLSIPFVAEAVVRWADPEVGDVVVLRSPFDDFDIVKRVVGVGGDRIEIRDDVVYRNGAPLLRRRLGACPEGDECQLTEEGLGERTWLTSSSAYSVPESFPEVVVPPGHVYVLGDHRDRSNDSRNPRVGTVPAERVRGRALLVYWSSDGRAVRWERVSQEVR